LSSLLIPRPKKVSDRQFMGDLTSLFVRNRIECGDPHSLDHFRSRLSSSDSFRSQLFTLCTAISHMSEADLSGVALLELVGRALAAPEGDIPDGMGSEFLAGYESWSNRDLDEPVKWLASRQTSGLDESPAATRFDDTLSDSKMPEVRAPGSRLHEALGMARKDLVAAQSGTNVEGLTISELMKLLEDIERRMTRIKPYVEDLAALARPSADAPILPRKAKEFGAVSPPVTAVPVVELRPALVIPTTTAAVSPLAGSVGPEAEDAFIARHAYLRPGQRLRPEQLTAPEPQRVVSSAAPPPLAPPVSQAAADRVPEMWSAPKPTVLGGSQVLPRPNIDTDVTLQPKAIVDIAIGALAAVLLVALLVWGMVVYRSLHPLYVYRVLQPESVVAQPVPNPAPGSSIPSNQTTARTQVAAQAGKPGPAGSGQKANRKAHLAEPKPPVLIWPRPPQ
jgi:hypothetical protein